MNPDGWDVIRKSPSSGGVGTLDQVPSNMKPLAVGVPSGTVESIIWRGGNARSGWSLVVRNSGVHHSTVGWGRPGHGIGAKVPQRGRRRRNGQRLGYRRPHCDGKFLS